MICKEQTIVYKTAYQGHKKGEIIKTVVTPQGTAVTTVKDGKTVSGLNVGTGVTVFPLTDGLVGIIHLFAQLDLRKTSVLAKGDEVGNQDLL